MHIALGIEYDGSNFNGWQSQDHGRTVQDCIETALGFIADEKITVQCAGRTDTGVHAVHQVAHFETVASRDPHSWVFGANSQLDSDVNLLWAQPVADDFHARYSATGRGYRYVVLNRPARSSIQSHKVTWECRALDVGCMQQAATDLTGEHDFSAFRAMGCQAKNPVRKLTRLDVKRTGNYVVIDVHANAFLQHMVRNIAGVLMEIGMGRQPPEWATEVLMTRDRTLGGVTAPADGLYLVRVDYPEKFAIPLPEPQQWPLCL